MASTYAHKMQVGPVVLQDVLVGSFGELKVAQSTVVLQNKFSRPLDTVKEAKVTGSVIQQYNRSLLKVSGDVSGGSSWESLDALRYVAGTTVEFDFTFAVSQEPGGAEYALAGGFDTDDGFYIGWIGSNFVVGYRNINYGDTTQIVDVRGTIIDWGKINRFRIRYGYLGVGNITYEVKTPTKWILLHTFETDGNLFQRTHTGEPIQPFRYEVASTDPNFFITSGSFSGQIYGDPAGQGKPAFDDGYATIAGLTVGQQAIMMAYRSKTTLGSYTNHVRAQLLRADFTTTEDGVYRFNIYVYPSGTFAAAGWTQISTSTIEKNATYTGSTTIPAGGRKIYSTVSTTGKKGSGATSIDVKNLQLIAIPGAEFIITKEALEVGTGSGLTTWDLSFEDLI